MNHNIKLAVLVALGLAACSKAPDHPAATLVVLDASIQTMNPAQATATALAVVDGKIAYIGDEQGAQPWIGKDTRVLRANKATVLPGMIDSHIHLMEGALSLESCTAEDAQLTLDKLEPIIRDCVARNPGDGWVIVESINGAGFKADRGGLDKIVPDRPLLLWGADGHSGWTNSAGLRAGGIDRNTKSPVGGHIERDRKGEPTGFLVDNALGALTDQLPKASDEKREELLLRALHELQADGVTTFLEANTSEKTIDTYLALAAKNQGHRKVTFALGSDGKATDEEFARLKALRAKAEAVPPMRANLIKLFEDGVMEYPSQTAAMLEPYLVNGKPGKNLGPLYHEPEPLNAFVERAAKEGFGMHIHVIGDRAARVALDAFEAARKQGSKESYSLTHLELVDPQDLPRFKQLDVVASLQLQWGQPDNYSVDAVLPYIGPERQGRLYPAKSLLDAGATIAGASDWSVSTFNPFEAIAIAMSRKSFKEPERAPLAPEQAVSLQTMLQAYTLNAARIMGREKEVGSLETGKDADFIVLDRTYTDATSSDDVFATKVVYTFIDGTERIGPPGTTS